MGQSVCDESKRTWVQVPSNHMKKLSRATHAYDSSKGGQRQANPWSHGSASLTKSTSFRFSERPYLKIKIKDDKRRHVASSSGFHMCTRVHLPNLFPHTDAVQGCVYIPAGQSLANQHLFVQCWGLNSGSHACWTSALHLSYSPRTNRHLHVLPLQKHVLLSYFNIHRHWVCTGG